jgi:DNA-binding MarR family transcriptional regulator
MTRLAPINEVDAEIAQGIYDHMVTNRGMKFSMSQLARHLHAYPLAIKPMVQKMVDKGYIEIITQGGAVLYYVMPEIEAQVRARRELEAVFRPLSADYMKQIRFAMSKRG